MSEGCLPFILDTAEQRAWTRRRAWGLSDMYLSEENSERHVEYPVATYKSVQVRLEIANYDKYSELLNRLKNECNCTVEIDESRKIATVTCPLYSDYIVEDAHNRAVEYRGFINYDPEKLRKLLPLLLMLHLWASDLTRHSRYYTVEPFKVKPLVTRFILNRSYYSASEQLRDLLKIEETCREPPSEDVLKKLERRYKELRSIVEEIVTYHPDIMKILKEYYGVEISSENIDEFLSFLREKIEAMRKYLQSQGQGERTS